MPQPEAVIFGCLVVGQLSRNAQRRSLGTARLDGVACLRFDAPDRHTTLSPQRGEKKLERRGGDRSQEGADGQDDVAVATGKAEGAMHARRRGLDGTDSRVRG